MPFSRHPLDYEVNRLLLDAGMLLQVWKGTHSAIPRSERKAVQSEWAELLGLDRAIERGLLVKYRFRWNKQGELVSLWLQPHPKVRRCPGIKMMKELFLQ